MKRYIRSSTTNDTLKQLLQEHGIDTTPAKYELYAETYERYESGRKYKKKFTCDGDYVAYFSMLLHSKPTYDKLVDYFSEDELEEFIEENPTVEDIADYASSSWWGDGDDFIIYLKNLNTGEYLYGPEETEDEYDEDEE